MCSTIENEMFCFAILQDESENKIYSNLTGRFSIESYTDMNYIAVCYVYKLNTILLCTIKNRDNKEMISAFKSCYNELNSKGHHPTLHVLDNNSFQAVKEYITSDRTNLKFVESYNHQVNAAENGCNAATYLTIATLCTINPACPVQLWNSFVPQIEATLNIIKHTFLGGPISYVGVHMHPLCTPRKRSSST